MGHPGTPAAGQARVASREPAGGGGPERLLVVVPFTPRRDLRHGGRVVAQLLERMAERRDVGVVHLQQHGESGLEPSLAERCAITRAVEVPYRDERAARRRRRADVLLAPLRGLPSQVGAVYERRLVDACVDVARSWAPDVIQVEHDQLAHCGWHLRRACDARLALTCHEPGLLASRDQARVTSGRHALAHRLDAWSWRRYWRRYLPAFDVIVTFTDADRAIIEEFGIEVAVESIGLGIEIPSESLSAAGHGDPAIVFVGGYRHPPNADAAVRLIDSIMPEVRRRVPGLRLRIVGADPTPVMRARAGELDEITGPVPAVEPLVDAALAMVLPLRLGGGMRVKLLEALAAGKAVVASPLAAAGLELVDGRELLLAEADADFVDAIVRLAGDQRLRESLGAAARDWAVRNLSWDARVARYERLYAGLLGQAG